MIDGLVVGLIGGIPSCAIAFVLVAASSGDPQGIKLAVSLSQICGNLIGMVVQGIYSITLDCSAKQGTWGKQIVGLKVTDMEGRRISVGRATGRFFARYLSACTCGIGFLMPLFTEKKQTLHDLICGTLVVNK